MGNQPSCFPELHDCKSLLSGPHSPHLSNGQVSAWKIDPPDVMEYGSFHIRCQSEDCTIAYVFREMLVTNTEVSSAVMVSGPGEGTV